MASLNHPGSPEFPTLSFLLHATNKTLSHDNRILCHLLSNVFITINKRKILILSLIVFVLKKPIFPLPFIGNFLEIRIYSDYFHFSLYVHSSIRAR